MAHQVYGDANTVFERDLQLAHMDPSLKALLEASVAENDNTLAAANMCGLPVLARVGGNDGSVPPWFTRQMARGQLFAAALQPSLPWLWPI